MAPKKTLSQKAGRYPRAVADVLKDARKLVAKQKIDVRIAKGQHAKNAGAVAAGVAKGTAKISGVGLLWLMEYIVRGLNTVLVDNKILQVGEHNLKVAAENIEKKIDKDTGQPFGESFFTKLVKKHPGIMSYLTYYMMLAGIVGGGFAGSAVADKIEERKIEKAEQKEREEIEKAKQGKYVAYLDKMRPLTPLLIADLIAKEGVRVNEQGLHVVYDDATGLPLRPGQKAKGKPTIGFGSTVLKDGTTVTSYTPPITTEEAYELSRYHLESGETYFRMYCYDIALGTVDINTTEQALGIASIIYNSGTNLFENPNDRNHKERFSRLHNLYKEHGFAMPDSLVLNQFNQYPIRDTRSFGGAWMDGDDIDVVANKLGGFVREGRGLYWRRWLEAGVLTGQITSEMLLECPANGMSEFFAYMGKKKSAFFTGDAENRQVNYETYVVFREWLKNPENGLGESLAHWKKVKDYLPADIVQICNSGMCKLGNKDFVVPSPKQEKIEKETYVIGYDDLYADAVETYRVGNYELAADKYQEMIRQYPDNALLRNDLAATYNNLGRYNDAIAQAREVVRRIGDKSQYGAAQYNAGFAYEMLGDYDKALANYKLAVANGNRRVQADVTRVIEKKQGKHKGKKAAFNDAAARVMQQSKSADFMRIEQIMKEDNNIS